jgi:D-3-phosphoglycerate dehydrogenase
MINTEQLLAMKKGAILINTARGGLIVEEALAQAAGSGHLAGAGIDTFAREPLSADHPFKTLDGIVMSPHMGGSTDTALDSVAVSVAQNVVDMLIKSKIEERLLVNSAVLHRPSTFVA